ncbi:HBR156Cp [Eremothecium sinecaudum]|uniref:HBR156Cp n=1 Tax=Eremothecium sinecaudum TaxID=45286 RepID=A0A109UXQ1_9SACH|nr:HBR156Cp [Eremothecium sinecaudum]AMD19057.1 HBR156Cp [Eremothecium sinecaudum]
MPGSSLDVDVDIDWLYKGKKRSRLRGVNRASSTNAQSDSEVPGGDRVRVRAVSVSTADLSREAPAMTREGAMGNEVKLKSALQTQTSVVNRQGGGSSSLLRRSNSVGEKPWKSLIGNLFGRRSSSSGETKSGSQRGRIQEASAHCNTDDEAAVEMYPEEQVNDRDGVMAVEYKHGFRRATAGVIPVQQISRAKLKRVMFAVDRLGADPPQQIPSRKPVRGNVLVPEDMVSDVPLISQGITTTQGEGGSNISRVTQDSREYKVALENYKKALKESRKHEQEAHYAALRIAKEVANFKIKHPHISGGTHCDTEVYPETSGTEIDERMRRLEIDNDIHVNERYFGEYSNSSGTSESTSGMSLELIYTVCCHLREILPIPSTLKQLKNKSAPLRTLKFLNPRPTLIDLLSFCDFVAVVPIHNVVFDNVNLTADMFKIVISSVANSNAMERLSLRNVTIAQEGWILLCKFLLENSSLVKLDISQTKIKQDCDPSLRRSSMDWRLFAYALRGHSVTPLEELQLNGIHFTDVNLIRDVLDAFTANHTVMKRLGIAQSDLSKDVLREVLNWASINHVQGVDLSYNNLQGSVQVMVDRLTALDFSYLNYFTLNSTSINSVTDVSLILRNLSTLPNLYFLDLSNMPTIFPEVFPYLNKYLPRFPNLKRLHLDRNELSSSNISVLCQILPKCKELLHVSLLQQPRESYVMSSCAALYDFVTNSSKITTLEVEYEFMSQEISSRIAVCLIRNAQKSIDEDFELDELTSQDDLLFDGELITETVGGVLSKLDDSSASLDSDSSRRYLLKKYWEKVNKVHDNVQRTISGMFEKRNENKLTLQGKENLLRLLLVDDTLTKILDILSKNPRVVSLIGNQSEDSCNQLKHIKSSSLLLPMAEQNYNDLDNSNSPITKPHLMATDSGRTIDLMTGKPVPFRTSSQTSIIRKKQEEEEGEFHKWGLFVEKRWSAIEEPTGSSAGSSPAVVKQSPSSHPYESTLVFSKIPSGAELKEAIIKAKGINSIEDLIDNVNHNRVKLDNIYGVPYSPTLSSTGPPSAGYSIASSNQFRGVGNVSPSSAVATSSDSADNDEEFESKVDETYDKLLNKMSEVRSNK